MSYNRGRFNYRKRGFSRGGSSSSGQSTPSNELSVQSFTNSANLPEVVRRSRERPLISVALGVIPGPYPGWKLYFPLEVYTAGSQTVKNIKATESHITRRAVLYNLQRCRKLLWYPIHMRALLGDPVFMEEWPMFQEDLRDKPEYTLNCLRLAMHQVLLMQNESTDSSNLDMVMARVMGHGPVIPLKNIRVHSYSKLVTIKGTVIRAGNPKLLCTWMTFGCRSCFAQQMVKQPAGVMAQPEKCVGENCLIRTNFIPILDTPCTRTTAWQTLKVQELKTADQFESGRVPRNVNIEVTADLVNLCCPGDDVTITGIVQVRALDDHSRRDQASMYKMYLEGISIQNQRENVVEDEYTERDYAAIQAIKSEPDVFRLLVNSLCPLICVRECPKAGLILALMGATKTSESDFINRNECHVLIVGDPGLGKSQMLKACADVAPR
ncbi:DNA helicase MCM8-like, partial [Ctenocephalides felis]